MCTHHCGGSGLAGGRGRCACILPLVISSFPFQASSDVALVNLGLMLCPTGMCIIHDVSTLMAGCALECVLAATRTYGPVCTEFSGCECDDGPLPYGDFY